MRRFVQISLELPNKYFMVQKTSMQHIIYMLSHQFVQTIIGHVPKIHYNLQNHKTISYEFDIRSSSFATFSNYVVRHLFGIRFITFVPFKCTHQLRNRFQYLQPINFDESPCFLCGRFQIWIKRKRKKKQRKFDQLSHRRIDWFSIIFFHALIGTKFFLHPWGVV